MKDDLEGRISRALAMKMTSGQLADLLADLAKARAASDDAYETAKAKALDPATRSAAVAEARRRMEDEQFQAARFAAAETRLEAIHAEVTEREANDAAGREYEEARRERDQLADDIRREYPAAAETIVSLLERLQSSDLRLERVNRNRSAEEWLVTAEAVARELAYDPKINPNALPSLSKVQLPKMTPDGVQGYLWPKSTFLFG